MLACREQPWCGGGVHGKDKLRCPQASGLRQQHKVSSWVHGTVLRTDQSGWDSGPLGFVHQRRLGEGRGDPATECLIPPKRLLLMFCASIPLIFTIRLWRREVFLYRRGKRVLWNSLVSNLWPIKPPACLASISLILHFSFLCIVPHLWEALI